MRPAVEVVAGGGVRINAKRVVQRGVHLAKGDRPFTGLSAEAVGRADDLPMLESAAGEQAAGDSRPVVAAGILVDGWCAAEFAPANHDDVLVETPLVEILDERREPLVEHREILPGPAEVTAVPVPATERK